MMFFGNMFTGNVILICAEMDSGEIYWMICKLSSSAKLFVNIPQLNWHFLQNILDIAGSSFSFSWVFYAEVVSIALYVDNPVTSCSF